MSNDIRFVILNAVKNLAPQRQGHSDRFQDISSQNYWILQVLRNFRMTAS